MSLYQRGLAVGMNLMGVKSTQIKAELDITRGALRSTLSFAQLRDEGESRRRSGWLLEYTLADKQNLVHYIQLHLKDTCPGYYRLFPWN
jgi:hypothetical protein